MPELPEVETVRSGLEKYVTGKIIQSAEIFHPRAIKPSSISPLTSCIGAQIKSVKRRGKFLWFELDRDFVLVAHLGMSGQLLVQEEKSLPQPHLRAKFGLSGNRKSNQDQIRFIDQRTFGWLSVEQTVNGIPVSVREIAYDPFEKDFNLKQVVSNIKRRKSAIKPAILNQNIISGVGNIYADEALWRAKIHPEIICEDLSEAEIRKVISSAISVMKKRLSTGSKYNR